MLILFVTAALFYFLTSSFFPLWILLVGPILWGVPHIFSSLRYSTLSFGGNARAKLLTFHFFAWAFVFVYRIISDVLNKKIFLTEHPLLLESIVLIFVFCYQLYLYKRHSLKFAASFLIFSAIILSTYFYPLQTALVALIGHNYLPLIAWYKSCQNKSDLNVFFICSSIYILFSFLIYFGALDSVYKIYTPLGHIGFLNWDYSEVISPFVLSELDYQFWFHIVVLYAFSQSIHYFIWMKAIPENYQTHQHPPSFQWSFNKLSSDFGFSSIYLILMLGGLGLGIWFLFEFQTARLVYFSIASYHGFMEIASLPFLKSNRKIES